MRIIFCWSHGMVVVKSDPHTYISNFKPSMTFSNLPVGSRAELTFKLKFFLRRSIFWKIRRAKFYGTLTHYMSFSFYLQHWPHSGQNLKLSPSPICTKTLNSKPPLSGKHKAKTLPPKIVGKCLARTSSDKLIKWADIKIDISIFLF